jgi:hydroxymethylbilane synthase
VRIGTRGSALALAQAQPIADALGGELVVIATSGDPVAVDPARTQTRATGENDKARWVSAIERALLDGDIDLAVHSAKDVPGELADSLVLLPSPPRADPRDAICGAASLADLTDGARIGTSSLRRKAQLLAARPDLEIAELRGNVDTRLRKLADGDFDAIVLAAAGLARLGRSDEGNPLEACVPAPGQGTLALEARVEREDVREAAAALADAAATASLAAERELMRELDADCDTPIGGYASPVGGGWLLRAFVGRADGSAWLRDELIGDDPEALGGELAQRLIAAGADDVLERSRPPYEDRR